MLVSKTTRSGSFISESIRDFRSSRFDLLNDRRRRQVRTGNQQHYEQRSTNK